MFGRLCLFLGLCPCLSVSVSARTWVWVGVCVCICLIEKLHACMGMHLVLGQRGLPGCELL